MTYYKVINPDGRTPQGYGRWDLPTKNADGTWTPGKWQRKRPLKRPLTESDLCTNRVFHVVRADQVLDWLGPVIAEVEVSGDIIEGSDKCGVRAARLIRIVEAWNERTARLFAVECAEEVLHLIPEPHRATSRQALDVARRYANGEATAEELAAARDAARDAARAAARDAARDAARAAARDAARDAAWDAARDAAWDAARDAAWAAARDAARDAAWAAARAAAWDATADAQKQRLARLLEGEPA